MRHCFPFLKFKILYVPTIKNNKISDNNDEKYENPFFNKIQNIKDEEEIYAPPYINLKSIPKKRKKNIPATIKRLVWNKYIGEEIGKSKCTCCNVTDITQMSFHCGHVIAELNGGEITVDNLRPICQNCNSSMRVKNMDDFKKSLE